MRTVSYKGRSGPESHTIYDIEEAQELAIPFYEDWRTAQQKGDYVKTEDGFVVEVLNVGRRDDKLVWIRTCTGSYTALQNLTAEDRECRWTFNGRNPGRNDTRPNKIFARMVAHGMDLVEAYMQTHPRAKNRQRARYRAMALFESKSVQKIVSEELGDILTKLGITKEYVLKGYKDLVEDADSDSVKISALNSLSKVVGLITEKKEETRAGLFLGFSRDEMKEIQSVAAGLPQMTEAVVVEEPLEPDGPPALG